MNRDLRIKCANCGESVDLPHNPSIARVTDMTNEFYKKHIKKGSECTPKHLFIRSFGN